MDIPVQYLASYDADWPKLGYAHAGDAGFDLRITETAVVPAGGVRVIPCGFVIAVPDGYEMQIRPRSGISAKTDLLVMLGTIDAGYRGEIKIAVRNLGEEPARIERGTRLAQGVIAPVVSARFEQTFDLFGEAVETPAGRGGGGFGSTGVSA